MRLLLILLVTIYISLNTASAATIIRDDEIEKTLRELIDPIIIAARLSPKNINIYIINDNAPNAFVNDQEDIFINSGLFIALEDPDSIISVIAHEIGHIKENHIIRRRDINNQQSKFIIFSVLLGGLSASAGSSDIGAALIFSGSHFGERNILKYSREFELAADKAAIEYLDKAYSSSIGLMKAFDYFAQLDKLSPNKINPYSITHPLNKDRLNIIKSHLFYRKKETNLDFIKRENFKRIIIKLKSFIMKPEKILSIYNDRDLNSIYARSIAYFRMGNLNMATDLLKNIIDNEPKNGYLYELLGQFYYEFGLIDQSIQNYKIALKINPESTFTRISLANSYISKSQDTHIIRKSIQLLKEAEISNEDNDLIFKSLAVGYGKIGDLGRSNLYLAKKMIINGNYDKAVFYANRAIGYFPSDSNEIIKAKDIIETSILQKK